ncbi:unnamed protein product [Effrenium voratum]|uniref:Uncharacterized protein n=1 Tax=Effrenium voratum TaxID=2562239 RepID=A0AA36N257_9DINO|nr:unnamed protein product [Effrenium voratum]CAJ1438550.1 unnamed protein product [Effrenium voratum]
MASALCVLLPLALASCEGPFCEDGFNALLQTEQRYLQRKLDASSNLEAFSGNPVMDDVRSAFQALHADGDIIKIDKGPWSSEGYRSYMPPYGEHIEGIQRLRTPGYFAFSGATAGSADLFLAQLEGSTSGAVGGAAGKVVKRVTLDTVLTHAGGFQVSGDLLAIGLEAQCTPMERTFMTCRKQSEVRFYDVSDPLDPKRLGSFIDRPGQSAGAVGIVQQQNGKWLALVGDGDNNNIDMYVQQEDGSWKLSASWNKGELLINAGVSGGYKSYQSMNLILQQDGKIFMVCAARSSMVGGADYFDLFSVQPTGSGRATVTMVASKHVTCHGCDFGAAGAVYVDSSRRQLRTRGVEVKA